ncbi:MAG: universal stress protein, partial [Chitinophagaceae bacterium]
MKAILAATNLSKVSTNAVEYAADMACALNAKLFIIYVNPLPIIYNDVPIPGDAFASMVEGAEKELEKLEEDINSRTQHRCEVHTQLVEGTVEFHLEEYCKTLNPFAVVMGTETSSILERTLFGAKTLTALKHLHWPLIIVPEDAQYTPVRKIGFACDFRDVRETVPVKEIEELVHAFNAELHIIHASSDSGDSYRAETVAQSEEIRNLLAGLHPKYHFIKTLNIEEPVMAFAEQHHLDLLI